ncbi:PREDICTED: THAP domain-containing protein 2-like [Rhagoletis zephyria]|uniref:THAP domain-containing protein 2-like n=1 Tax=Rhagoletis zephyria TaxID=28612 RepID=UPI000811234D|nr:PREDICTED: THAP domain-containing protein 2-like [Rhagoletis zephyria]XP_017493830.1 PREDICTED: THAP domain-containing protein 2-like [Rhagoletis zephyria]
MKCAVAKCGKTAAECSLFTFPSDPELRKKWIQFCRQSKDFQFKTCYICMHHFASEDFENSLQFEMGYAKRRLLKRGSVPSIYKPGDENPERSQRVHRRQNTSLILGFIGTISLFDAVGRRHSFSLSGIV